MFVIFFICILSYLVYRILNLINLHCESDIICHSRHCISSAFFALSLITAYCVFLLITFDIALFSVTLFNVKLLILTILILAFLLFIFLAIFLIYTSKLDIAYIFNIFVKSILYIICSIFIIFIASIFLSVALKSFAFFTYVSIYDFLFGWEWDPSMQIFGVIPLLYGTTYIALIAVFFASILGLFSGIYISEYMHPRYRNTVLAIFELLYSIPTFVYGILALFIITPIIRSAGDILNISISPIPAISCGITIAIMLTPMFISLMQDAIFYIPKKIRYASYALGATREETVFFVLIPAIKMRIISIVLFAFCRAIGETMIAVAAAGIFANMTVNPFSSLSTVTAQIVSLITGEADANSPEYLCVYALATILFLYTIIVNYMSYILLRKNA